MRMIDWLRVNGPALLLFELLYQVVFITIIVPLAQAAFQLAIYFSPYSYVTLQNLAAFLRRPLTILLLVLLLAVVAVFLFAEAVSLIVYFETCIRRRKVKVWQILFPGLKEVFRMLKHRENLMLLPIALLQSGIFMIPYTIIYIMHTRIPSYLIRSVMSEPLAAAAIVLVLFGLGYMGLRGFFIIPLSIHNRDGVKSSWKESGRLVRGNICQVLKMVCAVNLLFACCYVLCYVLCVVACGLGLFLVMDRSLVVAAFLTLIEEVEKITGFIGMIVGVAVNYGVITRLFCRLVPAEEYQEEYRVTSFRLGRRWSRVMAVLALLLVVGNSVRIVDLIENGSAMTKETLTGTGITAHRGVSGEAPENTIPALEKAIEYMADYAEIDVQLTADGAVILMHDSSLRRTTGYKKDVKNTTLAEIQSLDAGSWFSEAYKGTKVPLLSEALELCKGEINLNIEIKTGKNDNGLTQKVLDLIEEFEFANQCIISSTDYEALKQVKERYPEIKTGYIMGLAYGDFFDREYADFFSIKSSFITEPLVKRAHSFGKEIHAWTVNSEGELERMKQLEVDNIITDQPVRAREVLYRDEFLDGFIELLKVMEQTR